jgi:hypothetical protein
MHGRGLDTGYESIPDPYAAGNVGAYSLDIQASGYQNKTLGNINARQSVNLGDIPLD